MLRPMLAGGLALAALSAVAQAQGASERVQGFRTPSGNIHCMYAPADPAARLPAQLRCDLQQMTSRRPPRPKDCDLDWGSAFAVDQWASKGQILCASDSVADTRLPVLAHGSYWQADGFTCLSEETGLTCFNLRRAGFTLSRARQTLF